MANPYSTVVRGQYGSAQVLGALEQGGAYQPPYEAGGYYMNSGAMPPRMPATAGPPGFMPGTGGSMPPPMPPGMMPGNPGMMNQMARGPTGVLPTGMVEDFSRMPAPVSRGAPQIYDPIPGMPGEVVVAERIDEPQYIGERFIGQEWIYGVKPYITKEKYVEVPQTIIKEHTRHVPKPEIVERIIEVPKVGYTERHVQGPEKHAYVHNINEVPKGVITETIQMHKPKIEIQERLIEIPKIEYREIIEYDDRIEYREVPVDKIIEVPEIEYTVRPVERFVPQTYVQEYFIDHYTEVPVMQVQETERYEYVPVVQPIPNYKSVPVPMAYNQVQQVPVPVPVDRPVPVPVNPMMSGPMMSGPMGPPMSMANAYAAYEPGTPPGAYGTQSMRFDPFASSMRVPY